jgi:hypothetical protein
MLKVRWHIGKASPTFSPSRTVFRDWQQATMTALTGMTNLQTMLTVPGPTTGQAQQPVTAPPSKFSLGVLSSVVEELTLYANLTFEHP